MSAFFLAKDSEGNVAVFECRADSPLRRGKHRDRFEIAARLLAALAIRDGHERLVRDDDPKEGGRVLVIADHTAGDGYRTSAALLSLEEELPEAKWVALGDGNPRALFSSRPLARQQLDRLRARRDCVAIVGEEAAIEAARESDAFFYAEGDGQYVRDDRAVERPLRAEDLAGVDVFPLATRFRESNVVRVERAGAAERIAWRRDLQGGEPNAWSAFGCAAALLLGVPVAVTGAFFAVYELSKADIAFVDGGLVYVALLVGMGLLAGFWYWIRQPVRVRVRVAPPKTRVVEPAAEVSEEDSPRSQSAESRSSLRRSR